MPEAGGRSKPEGSENQRSQSTPGLKENVRVGWESERPSDRPEPPVMDTKGVSDELSASYAAHLTIKATSAEEPTPDDTVQDSEADVFSSPDKAMEDVEPIGDHSAGRRKTWDDLRDDEDASQIPQKADGDPTDMNTTMESALANPQGFADPVVTEAGQGLVGTDEPTFGRFSHSTIFWQPLLEAFQPFSERMSEPPLPNGKTRIRWTCTCGSRLFDDYIELKVGAAEKLQDALHAPNRQQPAGHDNAAGDIGTQSLNSGSPGMSASTFHSTTSGQQVNSTASAQAYEPPSSSGRRRAEAIRRDRESIWLMICAKARRRPASLLHLNVCSMASDQHLFTEMRRLYMELKRTWYYKFSLKAVQSIRFVQFELHPRDLVDVRKVPDMPSEAKKAEYLYQPCDLLPPVGENLMTHLFHHPHEANEKAITFLRSPKKRKQRLGVCPQIGTNIGWGIHLVEGYAITQIWLLTL
ncbi:MAG: hypothetical protein Q9183_004969, partial [Haloplaca sp. 2 TL-2023]